MNNNTPKQRENNMEQKMNFSISPTPLCKAKYLFYS